MIVQPVVEPMDRFTALLTGLELPFLQSSIVKVEAPDEDNFEDAVDSERGQSRGQVQ